MNVTWIKIQTEEYTQGRESSWLIRDLDVSTGFFCFLERLLLFWGFYWPKLHIWVYCWTGEMSSGGHFLCLNFTVDVRFHQYSSLCGLCPFTGETFLRRGAIGSAERNIDKTKKIIEHVTQSYHIDSLIKMNKWYFGEHAISDYSWDACLHHQKKQNSHSLFSLLKNQSSSGITCVCARVALQSLWGIRCKKSFRFNSIGSCWSRTHRKRTKGHRTLRTHWNKSKN